MSRDTERHWLEGLDERTEQDHRTFGASPGMPPMPDGILSAEQVQELADLYCESSGPPPGIGKLLTTCERLREQRDELDERFGHALQDLAEAAASLTDYKARLARVTAALEFYAYEEHDRDFGDRARAALAAAEEPANHEQDSPEGGPHE